MAFFDIGDGIFSFTMHTKANSIDADVIKTYVRLGLGVGIVAEMAVKDDPVQDLAVRPLGPLLGMNVARVAFKRGAYLRHFVYQFAELLSDRLTAGLVAKAMAAAPTVTNGIFSFMAQTVMASLALTWSQASIRASGVAGNRPGQFSGETKSSTRST